MSDLAEIKVSAVDQASAILASIKGKADDLSKSADGVKSSWNGGLMDGFTKGGALAAVGAIGAIVTAVGAAGVYFYSLTKSVMEAQAGLKKMSEVTGATVEGLSAIRSVAKLTGIDMEAVSGGLTKLAKNVETGGASTETALKAIGLSLKDLQGLKTDEQFMKVTKALDGYADGAGKTAAAQMLLGKSGAQLLPLMRDISEAGDLVVKTTAAQAKQADDLEKNIMRLTLAKQAWKKVVGTELVPVLDDVVTVLLKVQTETNGTLAASKELAADGSIKRWGQDAALAGAAAIDFAFSWIGAMKLMHAGAAAFGAGLVSVQADVIAKLTSLTPFVRGETAKMAAAAQENSDKMKTSFKTAFDSFVNTDTEKYTNKLKAQFAESGQSAALASAHFAKFGNTLEGIKPPVTGLGEKVAATAKVVKDATNAMGKALDDLFNKLNNPDVDHALLKEQLLLTKAFQTNAIGLAKYADGMALAVAQSKTFKDATKALEDAHKSYAESVAAAYAVTVDALEKNEQQNNTTEAALRDSIDALKLEAKTLNMTATERELYNLDLAKSAALQGADDDLRRATIAGLYEEKAALILNRAEIDANGAAYQRMGTFVDGFINAAMSGFKSLKDFLKNQFFDWLKQALVKPFVMQIAASVMGGGASMAASAMGGGGGESSLFGSLLSTVGSSVGTWLGGLQSAFAPTTVMTAMTTAWATGSAAFAGGASLISSIGTGLVAMGPVGWVALAVVAVVAALGLSKNETGIKIDNNLTNVGNPSSHFHKNALSDYDVSGDLPDKVFEVLFKAVDKIDKTLVDGLISAETTAAIRAKLNTLINPEWIGFDDEASAAKAIAGASKEFLAARYGAVFGEIDERIAATIRNFGGNAEELLTYIAGVVSVMDTLQKNAKEFTALIGETVSLGQISDLAREGETLAQTLGRVITVFTVTNAVANFMGKDAATAFGAVGLASLKARENLIELAGGIQALGAMSQSFYEKYYSDDERAAITLKNNNDAINATFKELNIAIPKNTAEFRALVEAQDLTTVAGRKTWAALMKVEGAFYAVNKAIVGVIGSINAYLQGGISDTYNTSMGPGSNRSETRVTDKGAVKLPIDQRLAALEKESQMPQWLVTLLRPSRQDTRATDAKPVIANQALIDAMTARRNLESASYKANDALAQQSNSLLYAYNKQAESIQGLLNISPRSAGALSAVTAGMYSMRDATAALLIQIQQVKNSVGGMFGNTITSLKLSTMSKEQQYAYYQKDAEEARAAALKSTDPLEIQRLAERVNKDVLAAQGLLTDEQQKQTNPDQIANLEKFNKELQDWLDKQAKTASDANDVFLAKLEAKFKSITDAQADIQKKSSDSIDKFAVAASTPHEVDIRFTANVPGYAATSEVGG